MGETRNLKDKFIVFYDGSCGLCHGSVQWLLKTDKRALFYFATQQGRHYQPLTNQSPDVDAIVYYRKGDVYEEAEALAWICYDLGGVWRFFYGVWKVLPSALSRYLYFLVAKRRYGIFGKATSCKLPEPNERMRMLE